MAIWRGRKLKGDTQERKNSSLHVYNVLHVPDALRVRTDLILRTALKVDDIIHLCLPKSERGLPEACTSYPISSMGLLSKRVD